MAEHAHASGAETQGSWASFNGRIAGIAIGLSSIGLAALAMQPLNLAPMTIFIFGTMSFGVWAFCDEMGTEKPLIRAGMVAFVLAVFGRVSALLFGGMTTLPGAYILYAIATSIAILLWSVAFLHRRNIPKVAGLIGAVGGLVPVVVFVLGHVLVGTAVVMGSASLLTVGAYPENFGMREVEILDYLLSAWGIAASWLLLTGRIVKPVP